MDKNNIYINMNSDIGYGCQGCLILGLGTQFSMIFQKGMQVVCKVMKFCPHPFLNLG